VLFLRRPSNPRSIPFLLELSRLDSPPDWRRHDSPNPILPRITLGGLFLCDSAVPAQRRKTTQKEIGSHFQTDPAVSLKSCCVSRKSPIEGERILRLLKRSRSQLLYLCSRLTPRCRDFLPRTSSRRTFTPSPSRQKAPLPQGSLGGRKSWV